jgi:hypothetical protein
LTLQQEDEGVLKFSKALDQLTAALSQKAKKLARKLED